MMKLLVLPRDPNPYQDLLYGEMKRLGVQISYIGELTPSHTVNLLLLPLELGLRRILGARFVHLHWVFSFSLPGTRRFPLIRVVAQAWFLVWLRMCRMLGVHLVWTVHNVLPHRPVFANDASARRSLVKACDLVLAHSPSALAELSALGASARRTARRHRSGASPRSAAYPLRGRRDSSISLLRSRGGIQGGRGSPCRLRGHALPPRHTSHRSWSMR